MQAMMPFFILLMKLILSLLLALVFFSCKPTPKPQTYTIELIGKGEIKKKEVITVINDSLAYAKGMFAFYGAKIAASKYKLTDEYDRFVVRDTADINVTVRLSQNTINDIEKQILALPSLRSIK